MQTKLRKKSHEFHENGNKMNLTKKEKKSFAYWLFTQYDVV